MFLTMENNNKNKFIIIAAHDYGKNTVAEEFIKSGLSIVKCNYFVGILNEPNEKCNTCGKEEWEHNL
jgi:hypothetical protein